MYSSLPSLVLAFHGCDQSTHDRVIGGGERLRPSRNDYDWLGEGIYFWEQNLERALSWAEEQRDRGAIDSPAVVGAVIDLGYCLNLTDSRHIDLLAQEYKLLQQDLKMHGQPMPKNTGKTEDRLFRRLDCAVIQHLHARMDQEWQSGKSDFQPFDSVRGLFSEGRPIYPGAGFKAKTHVQICVRNPNCIKGYFSPMERVQGWRTP